jgi:hypothetical protein
MTPLVEALAQLLDRFPVAMLTLVDEDGRPRTRPMKTVKAGFNGHIWLRADNDPAVLAEIGRGTQVSVAYGSAEAGQYVTVYGWAIVLTRESPYGITAMPGARRTHTAPLVCVSAHAAEMWDVATSTSPRIFAFPHSQPSADEEPVAHFPALPPAARRPKLATLDAAAF